MYAAYVRTTLHCDEKNISLDEIVEWKKKRKKTSNLNWPKANVMQRDRCIE